MNSHQAGPGSCERGRLVAGHACLVEREAARYRTWHIDRADLRQAGILGLLIAAARFDPERAVPFAAYTHTWVRKEIQRAISQQEFPAVLPPDLIGRTVALRRALAENSDKAAPGRRRAGHLTDDRRSAPPATPRHSHRGRRGTAHPRLHPHQSRARRHRTGFHRRSPRCLGPHGPTPSRRAHPALRPRRSTGTVIPSDRPSPRRLRPHRPQPRRPRPGPVTTPHHLTRPRRPNSVRPRTQSLGINRRGRALICRDQRAASEPTIGGYSKGRLQRRTRCR